MKQNKERVKLKSVLYFFYGLLTFPTFFISLIASLLWLKFKAKTNRKSKFIALLVGLFFPLILSILFSLPFIQGPAKEWLYKNNPDMKAVDVALSQKYPHGDISISTEDNTSFVSGQDPVHARYFMVTYESDQILSKNERVDMAKNICSTLASQNKNYDVISITSKKSVKLFVSIPFLTQYETERGSCKDWNTTNTNSQ
jgi:hypothetical protein